MSDVNLMADTLSKCSHTPGPWMVGNVGQREDPRMVYCDDSLGSRVADCSTSGIGLTVEQDLANARLIAAAPDLLKALKYLQRHYVGQLENARDRIVSLGGECDPVDVMERGDPHLRVVREVIAKAEGRA